MNKLIVIIVNTMIYPILYVIFLARIKIQEKLNQLLIDLNYSNTKLEEKNKEILELTDFIVHDLKKPLSAIKSVFFLVEVESICKLTNEGKEIIKTGSQSINYMQELLEDLLTSARMEAGVQYLKKETVNLQQVIEFVLNRYKPQIDSSGIVVNSDINTEIFADPKTIVKVFMNLIGNAISYIGDGDRREININASTKDKKCHIAVSDTGMGIPDESKKHIFDKFKRGSNTQGISGTGMGLFIVKSAIEAHGGKIWMESELGKGTTFYLYLPDSDSQIIVNNS